MRGVFKINYFIIVAITLLTAAGGSRITRANLDWYQRLNLPSFTPQAKVIGFAWTVIFALSALAAILAWNSATRIKGYKMTLAILFLINAGLNLFWTYLFFEAHLLGAAVLEAVLLELSVLALIIFLWRKNRVPAIFLVPYAAWVLFATYLSYAIYSLN